MNTEISGQTGAEAEGHGAASGGREPSRILCLHMSTSNQWTKRGASAQDALGTGDFE